MRLYVACAIFAITLVLISADAETSTKFDVAASIVPEAEVQVLHRTAPQVFALQESVFQDAGNSTDAAAPAAAPAADPAAAEAAESEKKDELSAEAEEKKAEMDQQQADMQLKADAKMKKAEMKAEEEKTKQENQLKLKMEKIKADAAANMADAQLKVDAADKADSDATLFDTKLQQKLKVSKVKEQGEKKQEDIKEKSKKKALKVKLKAKMEKMRAKEDAQKQKRALKDPVEKELRKRERSAARDVRAESQHLTRVTRRMNRAAKYSVRQMRAHVVERVRAQEKLASKVVSAYAKKKGIKTTSAVHFKLDIPDGVPGFSSDGDQDQGDGYTDAVTPATQQQPSAPAGKKAVDSTPYVPLRFATAEMVRDSKAAFGPGSATKAAQRGVELAEAMASEEDSLKR
jgi:hypothetical protein